MVAGAKILNPISGGPERAKDFCLARREDKAHVAHILKTVLPGKFHAMVRCTLSADGSCFINHSPSKDLRQLETWLNCVMAGHVLNDFISCDTEREAFESYVKNSMQQVSPQTTKTSNEDNTNGSDHDINKSTDEASEQQSSAVAAGQTMCLHLNALTLSDRPNSSEQHLNFSIHVTAIPEPGAESDQASTSPQTACLAILALRLNSKAPSSPLRQNQRVTILPPAPSSPLGQNQEMTILPPAFPPPLQEVEHPEAILQKEERERDVEVQKTTDISL